MTKAKKRSYNPIVSADFEDEDEEEEFSQPIKQSKQLPVLLLSGTIEEGHLALVQELLKFHYDSSFNGPITLLINSSGGRCDIGWSIIDVMNFIRLPIHTVCLGFAASMAANIFINGDKRTIAENGSLMVHTHSSVNAGSHNKLIATLKGDLMEYERSLNHYLKNSKYASTKEVEKTFFSAKGEDLYLSPQECLEHGIADEVAIGRDKKRKQRKKASTVKRPRKTTA